MKQSKFETNRNIIINGKMDKNEALKYVEQIRNANPDKDIEKFVFNVDGEYVDVNYTYHTKNFERIRRITGYLVGTLDRFNDAKRAEVEDRVKHPVGSGDDEKLLEKIK